METFRQRIDMEAMNTNGDALESYLMKSFLVDMMPIVHQPFGRRFLFCSSGLSAIILETLNRNSNVYQPSLIDGQHTCQYKMLGSISVFLIYVGSMTFLCIYWAMALTENAQNLFFILFLSVTLTDMFFVQPIRIFIHWIGVWRFCISPQLVRKLEHVRKRSKLLLSRSFGVVRDANRAIQHLNPACRISRYLYSSKNSINIHFFLLFFSFLFLNLISGNSLTYPLRGFCCPLQMTMSNSTAKMRRNCINISPEVQDTDISGFL